MAYQTTKDIVLPGSTIKAKNGMVVLPLQEYEKMREKIDRLQRDKRNAAEEAEILEGIAEAERDYREGRLKPIKSLAELR